MSADKTTLHHPEVLSDLLHRGLALQSDATALETLERSWSWRELEDSATRLAKRYLGMGLKPGDRIASLLPNRGLLLIHYLACLKAGLVATPLNYRYQAPEIDHALAVSGAAMLIVHAERAETIKASSRVPLLEFGCVSVGAEAGGNLRLEDLVQETSSDSITLPTPDGQQPAFIFFTSGSTGKPKGVTHTHASFGWLVASARAALSITTNDVFLPATSASHVAACSFSLAGLAAGARVVLARSFDGDELLPLLRRCRPSLLCMLPSPLFGLVRDHRATHDDFRSIRRCLSGGDKIPHELADEFRTLTGFDIEEVYGMTELGTVTLNPTGSDNRLGSMGKLAPTYAASIRDERGAECGSGQPGRLWIQSPSMMTGYWDRPDATAETIVDGWLDTGDVVQCDESGYLWFRGRRKQIIVHDGSNVCPQEVEDSLLEHPAVAAAGVIGIHSLVHGENVRAYVTVRPNVPQPTVPELQAFSRARVGYKAPDEIVVLQEMPTNAVGKLDRQELKALAEADLNDSTR